MVSILIPVFNFDCTELVNELSKSCVLAKINYEILIGNDGSTDESIISKLNDLNSRKECKVITESQNIGRAFVLNHLAQLSAYPYLIIIDSDALVPHDDFIEQYLLVAVEHDVVCGGIITQPADKTADNTLRYRYETAAAKSRGLKYRKAHPYEKLSTFNLLIRRSVFDVIRFDQKCYQYGYEDTVLGLNLMKKGIEIVHIDNPLIHTGIDSNSSFLHKTHMALHVLRGLDHFYQEQIRISHTAHKLRRHNMLWCIRLWHKLFGRLEYYLLMRYPRLFVFNLYKLGYFSLLLNEKHTQRYNGKK